MIIAYLCVLIAAVLPYIFVGYAKFATKGYDNSKPREFLERQEGRVKRAHYAHLNSFEAFPAFAVAVILAQLAGVDLRIINCLAIAFIALRIVYGVCYIMDRSALRSLVWILGFLCVISLFILAIIHSSY